MKRSSKIILLVVISLFVATGVLFYINKSDYNPNPKYKIGEPLDSLNGIPVYYNGMVGHTGVRNTAPDGYNIGMKYQCVEFVKRYYYQRFGHKMPDAFGNAKDFFNTSLPDSAFNAQRGLMQFTNGSKLPPQAEDLLIFDGHTSNPYGHVAIVAMVDSNRVVIIQQNPGPFGASRDTMQVVYDGLWHIKRARVLGWLRKVK